MTTNPIRGKQSEKLYPAGGRGPAPTWSSRLLAMAALGALAFACMVAQILAYEVTFDAALDSCDQFHQSPNNALGWGIGLTFWLIPVVVGVVYRRLIFLPWTALVAAAQGLFLVWSTLPAGTC